MKNHIPLVLFSMMLFIACASKDSTNSPAIKIKEHHKITVGLYPLGQFESIYLALLKDEVHTFYGYDVSILKGSSLPKIAYYAPRNRYRADSLLNYLLRVRPSNVDYIVGLTQKDISCTNDKYPDWGVFGLGFMPGKSCVISTFRLKIGAKSEAHFRERLSKVVLHELGHNFGLDHCASRKCFMADAEGTIKSVDNEEKDLCIACKNKLKKLLP
jgi:archaemetzincin